MEEGGGEEVVGRWSAVGAGPQQGEAEEKFCSLTYIKAYGLKRGANKLRMPARLAFFARAFPFRAVQTLSGEGKGPAAGECFHFSQPRLDTATFDAEDF